MNILLSETVGYVTTVSLTDEIATNIASDNRFADTRQAPFRAGDWGRTAAARKPILELVGRGTDLDRGRFGRLAILWYGIMFIFNLS